MMISVGIQVLLAAVLMAVAITFSIESFQEDLSLAMDEITQSLTRSFAVLITAASSIGLSISSIRQWLRTPVSESAKIVDDAASGAIRQKLGFMHIIKQELDRLGKVLQGERRVPNFLEYLLPTDLLLWLQRNEHTHTLLLRLLGLSQHVQDFQRCRMVIYVDDLDRCPTEKVMEVLQSLVLLTEGTPFIIFLAIDQRVVVTAIENSGEGLYNDAGVNGHEYLDKIVQIPFVIPQLADDEKAKLCKGYLTPAAAAPPKRTSAEIASFLELLNKQTIGSRYSYDGIEGDLSFSKLLLVEELRFDKCGLIDGDLPGLVSLVTHPEMAKKARSLNLEGNPLVTAEAWQRELPRMLTKGSLTSVKCAAARVLAFVSVPVDTPHHQPHSSARSLQNNGLGPKGAAALAEGLKGNSTLQSLE